MSAETASSRGAPGAPGGKPGEVRRSGISVVIPTLNEAAYLPGLLESLARQTWPPDEVIVVDARSSDGTPAIATAGGAAVVPEGGLPGYSRNLGSAVAKGEWLLFLDADVRLAPDALEVALAAMDRRRLDAASCWFVPDSRRLVLRLQHWLSAAYFWLSTRIGWAHSIGGFLLVRRSLHDEVKGFDTRILVAEDQDYVVRLGKAGRYAFLTRPSAEIAARRFESEGVLRMSAKWLGVELHRIFLGEIEGDYFRYFGSSRAQPRDETTPPHGNSR